MQKTKEAGLIAGLNYIYIGNVSLVGDTDTRYPRCGQLLIERSGFGVINNTIKDGQCPKCGFKIAGVGLCNKNHTVHSETTNNTSGIFNSILLSKDKMLYKTTGPQQSFQSMKKKNYRLPEPVKNNRVQKVGETNITHN